MIGCLWWISFGHAEPQSAPEPAYDVLIDGERFGVDLGTTQEITIGDRTVILGLEQRTVQTFRTSLVTFEHPNNLSVSSQKVHDDLTQHLFTTALGTTIAVQEYRALDARLLLEIMVDEMTKEAVAAGFRRQDEPLERTSSDAWTWKGKSVVLTANVHRRRLEVVALPLPRGSLLVMTQIDEGFASADQAVIDGFWSTLAVTAPSLESAKAKVDK